MKTPVSIHKLSARIGLTSRTLRHWESEGLFVSMRDKESGWRVYDEEAVLRIHITALLRQLDVPIFEIKAVLEYKTYDKLREAIVRRLSLLKVFEEENRRQEKRLKQFLSAIEQKGVEWIEGAHVHQLAESIRLTTETEYEREKKAMQTKQTMGQTPRFITLPPMRVVYNVAVSVSPEEEAMKPVIDFIQSQGLTGTARLFGGDVNPMPGKEGLPYGYGMCASIPEGAAIPGHLQEMRLPGGLYACMESSDDIGGSWKTLMKLLSKHEEYQSDRSRLCLEEHIRNDRPDGSGNEYCLNLLEPVKRRG